jgi:hypothetical protein
MKIKLFQWKEVYLEKAVSRIKGKLNKIENLFLWQI